MSERMTPEQIDEFMKKKTWIPVPLLAPIFLLLIAGLPLAISAYPTMAARTLAERLLGLVIAPATFTISFVLIAALLSLPFQKAIAPGKFPRRIMHFVYGPRKLFGLCWGAIFYSTPIYFCAQSFPFLRTIVFRGFGYRGHADITVAPDAWIRDLPILKFSQGCYIANKATIGSNICLANGMVFVDQVVFGKKVMIGHMAIIGPGSVFGDGVEVGVACAQGIRVALGAGTKVNPRASVNHGAMIAEKVVVGSFAYIGLKAQIAAGIKIPSACLVPDGHKVSVQNDVDALISAERMELLRYRTQAEEVYASRSMEMATAEAV